MSEKALLLFRAAKIRGNKENLAVLEKFLVLSPCLSGKNSFFGVIPGRTGYNRPVYC
jgi:hypothetical protein